MKIYICFQNPQYWSIIPFEFVFVFCYKFSISIACETECMCIVIKLGRRYMYIVNELTCYQLLHYMAYQNRY